MPEVDGLQLLHFVRGCAALRAVPVVMMSALGGGAAELESSRSGAEEYLVKPVTRAGAARIWEHVARSRAAAAAVPQAGGAGASARPSLDGAGAGASSGASAGTGYDAGAAAGGAAAAAASTAAFLRRMRAARAGERAALEAQLAALDADAAAVAASMPRGSLDSALESSSDGAEPAAKRPRAAWDVVAERAPALDPLFFARRGAPLDGSAAPGAGAPGAASAERLGAFAADLAALASASRLAPRAAVRCAGLASPQEMVCAADFDAADAHFATVSVSRALKVYSFASVLEAGAAEGGGGGAGGELHFPCWQARARAKLSSVSWDPHARTRLATAGYDGAVQLWDAGAPGGAEAGAYEELRRRAWAVHFSPAAPRRLAAGADDGAVRVFDVAQRAAAARLQAPASVCSVAFSPVDGHLLAAGCADRRVYLWDLRRAAAPAAVIAGAARAVSYVRFLDGSRLAAASTDSAVRLWGVAAALEGGSGAAAAASAASNSSAAPRPLRTFRGHRNERNFVGLSVAPGGYLACGSEDDAVHAYFHALPFPIATHSFAPAPGAGGGGAPGAGAARPRPFVSSVTWARGGRHCLAANSAGLLRVLKLE
jgi:protein suppressor of PHYA-105 1